MQGKSMNGRILWLCALWAGLVAASFGHAFFSTASDPGALEVTMRTILTFVGWNLVAVVLALVIFTMRLKRSDRISGLAGVLGLVPLPVSAALLLFFAYGT